MDSFQPSIFVGIPTINRPSYVRETIDSVLYQTFENITICVSDNGSNEATRRSIKNYVESRGDQRLSFVAQSENLGEYGQGRYFFKQSIGHKYFVILHDDDVLLSEYLKIGIRHLEADDSVDLFVADPFVFDAAGQRSLSATKKYHNDHKRTASNQGPFDIRQMHMEAGFTPISGTIFRRDALVKSGFVDEATRGNYPFECEVFLNLGDLNTNGWYQKEELMGIRFHEKSARNYMNLMSNNQVLDDMMVMFEKRRYQGRPEQRRRAILGRLRRSKSLILIDSGDYRQARRFLIEALSVNLASLKSLLLAVPVITAPRMVRLVRSLYSRLRRQDDPRHRQNSNDSLSNAG